MIGGLHGEGPGHGGVPGGAAGDEQEAHRRPPTSELRK